MPLRNIPTLSEILENPTLKSLLTKLGRGEIVSTALNVLDELRNRANIVVTERTLPTVSELADVIARRITHGDPSQIGPVINATGELFPETLSSFPLVAEAQDAVNALLADYSGMGNPLSVWDSTRQELAIETYFQRLTGVESALILNSPASGLLLLFSTFAKQRTLILSRGHLYESRRRRYRLTDLLDSASISRIEVGTTNRTLITDYQQALESCPGEALIFYAYPGHYNVVGSAEMPPVEDVLKMAHATKTPVAVETGVGGIWDMDSLFGTHIPSARKLIHAGADMLLMTGDYLLNGPNCGILMGKHDWIQPCREHPFTPALLPNPMVQTALEATLEKYAESQNIEMALPILQLLQASMENLRYRAQRIARRLEALSSIESVRIRTAESFIFEGHPDTPQLETVQLCVHPFVPEGSNVRAELAKITRRLTANRPAVWGNVESNTLVLDLRSVFSRQDSQLVEAFENMRGVEVLEM